MIGDSSNTASIRLHAAPGFRRAGRLRSIGFKHGSWIDTVYMQRALVARAERAAAIAAPAREKRSPAEAGLKSREKTS